MASRAVLSKSSLVHVVLLVASIAILGQFDLGVVSQGILMTFLASELFVRTIKRKLGLLVVIENPDHPTIGIVAKLASLAQGPLVYVLFLMTGPTIGFCILIRGGEMALVARCYGMESD